MALIKCPECGKEISDKATACPNCGCPIQAAGNPNSVELSTTEEKPKKKTKTAVIAVVVAIAVLGVLCAAYFAFLSPDAKLRSAYNKAVALYNSGNYVEALPMFENIGEYSNSADSAVWCRYELAKEAISKEEYETAKEYLEGMDYQDSAVLSKQCDYQFGIQAMEAHNWESAASFFEGLDYENSEKMLTDCSFMIAIEESITRRMEINSKESSNYKTLVTTEMAFLEPFRNAVFYNSDLAKLAKMYIHGLDTQLDSLDYELYYEFQIEWQEGMVERYTVLNSLYQNYDFMKDNQDFVGTYISQFDSVKNTLEGYYAIEKDLSAQYDDPNYGYVKQSGNYTILTLKNNTQFTFTSTWEFVYYDKNGVKLKSVSVTVSDIMPGQTYQVKAYNSDSWDTVNWPNYYGTIR